jgi:hypothetical protein
MHDHQHAADMLRKDTPGITIICCRDPYQAWLDEMAAQGQREEEEHERDVDTADRLGLRMPDDDQHGNVVAICEGCTEEWPHGLEVVGGAALCQPCIDALDGGAA